MKDFPGVSMPAGSDANLVRNLQVLADGIRGKYGQNIQSDAGKFWRIVARDTRSTSFLDLQVKVGAGQADAWQTIATFPADVGSDVRCYGAYGDGSNDDTVAIQAAIDANKGGTVLIPPGTYLCAGLTLDGSSYNDTRIISTGGELKLLPDGGLSNFQGVAWAGLVVRDCARVFLDIKWDGNRSAMTANEHIHCVILAGASQTNIARLHTRETRGDSLYVCQKNAASSSTNSSNIVIGELSAVNSADDGRNAISIISCAGLSLGHLFSYQVGGVIGSTTEPGGFDIEPDQYYHSVTDVVVGSAHITTAGTSGFQILGKPGNAGLLDSARDWNVQRVTARNVHVVRTGSSGSGLAASNIIRCLDVDIGASTIFLNGYGVGWQLDHNSRLAGTLGARHVTKGIRVAPAASSDVQDIDLRVEVSDFTVAGIAIDQTTRGRFTGRISGASGGSAIGVLTTDDSKGGVTLTDVKIAIDVPYDGVMAKGYQNETAHPVAFSNTEICDCDYTGWANFSLAFDTGNIIPYRRNVRGIESSSTPSSGRWRKGEFVPNTGGVASSGGAVLLGWWRITDGLTNTVISDWLPSYATIQPTGTVQTIASGGSLTVNLATAGYYEITTGSSITISAPTNAAAGGQELEFLFINGSGGALTITWASAYKVASTFAAPGGGKKRGIRFRYNASGGVWYQVSETGGEI